MTIRELIDKLNLIIDHEFANENDLVFFGQIGEDEGNTDSLYPVNDVVGGPIQFYDFMEKEYENIINREGIELCFIVDGVKKLDEL